MKQVVLISNNKMLAQGLEAALLARTELEIQLLPLLNYRQALVGVQAYEPQAAILDATQQPGNDTILELCASLRKADPACKILLMVSADTAQSRDLAVEAKQQALADDFVFYDSSLSYLFAKLSAI